MTETRSATTDTHAPAPLAPRSGRQPGRRRTVPWVVVVTVALLALVAVGVARFLHRPDDGPRVVTDAAFVSAAGQLCRATLPDLRPPTTKSKTDVVTAAQTAAGVNHAADGITGLAGKLSALPVAEPAQAASVQAWLADWHRYADVGRQYASLLQSGNVAGGQRVAQSGGPAYQRADKFARANHLDDCQFYVLLRAPQNSGDSYF